MTAWLRRSVLPLVLGALSATACGFGAEADDSPPPPPVAPSEQAPALNMTGTWSSLFGGGTGGGAASIVLTLTQNGRVVTGSYESAPGASGVTPPGTLTGTLQGDTVQGTWSDSEGFTGPFSWNVTADGRTFAGTWSSSTLGGAWTGTRRE